MIITCDVARLPGRRRRNDAGYGVGSLNRINYARPLSESERGQTSRQ